MVARRMRCAPGKPQQPASPVRRSPNRARSYCSSNSPDGIHRRALQHLFPEKEGRGLSPGQISDLDRARRGIRRTSKESAGDSVGAPPQRPGSKEDIPQAATLPSRKEPLRAVANGAGRQARHLRDSRPSCSHAVPVQRRQRRACCCPASHQVQNAEEERRPERIWRADVEKAHTWDSPDGAQQRSAVRPDRASYSTAKHSA